MKWKKRKHVIFVLVMARLRARARAAFLPALSTLLQIYASLLLGLASVCVLIARLRTDRDYMFSDPHLHPVYIEPSTGYKLSSVTWKSRNSELYHGCSSPSRHFHRATEVRSNGYLLIATSGGLNQQRIGITDSVVVARLLNATLVVPELDHHSYWKDNSNFSDIFDVDLFIKVLAPDVVVIKQLPPSMCTRRMVSMRVPRKSSPQFYRRKLLPMLHKKQVLRLTKFDYRLSNTLDLELQKLRCRVNYNALHFTESISIISHSIIRRIRQLSNRYIALHLRFESDMLAFSGCYYGGGEKEMMELGAIRKRWKTLHVETPEKERRNGKCPLTPNEVGLLLKAFGFGNDSVLYVASGDVYGGDSSLEPLKALFPNLVTKESLASKEELQPFSQYSSRMAAIDYIVCEQSNVFIANNNGNMARLLAGQRRYFGHKRTIRPNMKKLGPLFLDRAELSWDEFSSEVRASQKGFMGEPNETKPGRGEFYENPSPCICNKSAIVANSDNEYVQNVEHGSDIAKYIVSHALNADAEGLVRNQIHDGQSDGKGNEMLVGKDKDLEDLYFFED